MAEHQAHLPTMIEVRLTGATIISQEPELPVPHPRGGAHHRREQLAARLRMTADRAYDQFAGGLGEYGKGG